MPIQQYPNDMDDADGLYLLASTTGIMDFYLVEDNAFEKKEQLEEKYPPGELDLGVFQINDFERVD